MICQVKDLIFGEIYERILDRVEHDMIGCIKEYNFLVGDNKCSVKIRPTYISISRVFPDESNDGIHIPLNIRPYTTTIRDRHTSLKKYFEPINSEMYKHLHNMMMYLHNLVIPKVTV